MAYPIGLKKNLLVFFLFVILTAVATWPLPMRLNTFIIGEDSDVFINPWADWWTAKAWSESSVDFWYTEFLFYPTGTDLAFHSFSHLNTILSLSLRSWLGLLAAYNVAILLNYVLAGWAMFHLARYLTNSTVAAVVAGIIFAFNAHNQYQSAHPVLVSIWCIPWSTLFLMRAVKENNLRFAATAAFFIFLTAAASTLLLILTVLWLTFLLLYMTMVADWPWPKWPVLLTFSSLSILATLPLVYPLLHESVVNHNSSFAIGSDQFLYMADIASPLIPHWKLWLVRGLYIGIVPFIFLVSARYRWRETRLWYFLAIGSYLISIGPYPTLLGQELDVVLPWSLPIVPLLRNPYRLNILLSLGLAMLVAFGLTVMLQTNIRQSRWRTIVGVIVALVIFAEYTLPRFPMTRIEVSPFYTQFLAAVPDDVALAMLPINRDAGKKYMYYQTVHGHPITAGTVSRPSPAIFTFTEENALLRAGVTDRAPAPIPADIGYQLSRLAEANIGYLVLHKQFMTEVEWQSWSDAIPFTPIYEDQFVISYSTELSIVQD